MDAFARTLEEEIECRTLPDHACITLTKHHRHGDRDLSPGASIVLDIKRAEWLIEAGTAVRTDPRHLIFRTDFCTWLAHYGEMPSEHVRLWFSADPDYNPENLPSPAPSAELVAARTRIAELESEVQALKEEIGRLRAVPSWANHDSSMFRLLPTVIAEAQKYEAWPKQDAWVATLEEEYGVSKTEARALDLVTRPDERRGK